MKEQLVIQHLLRKKLAETQEQNPRYSLRAFANRLGLNPGAVSGILNGKRFVSKDLVQKIAANLLLDPQERAELLGHFPEKRRYRKMGMEDTETVDPKYLEISAAQFRVIGEWEHYAILSLLNTKDFRNDTEWIANRLGISSKTASSALERLASLELIEKDLNGKWIRTKIRIRTTDDIADISVKKSHEQGLDLAKESLRKHAVSARDHTAVTMAIDPQNLPRAKELIRKFQDDISELLEAGNQTEVYRLAVQLFPLTSIK